MFSCTFPTPILAPKSLPWLPQKKRLSVSNAFRHHPAPPRHSPTPSSPFTVGLMFTLFWVYVGPSWDYVGANLVLAGVLVVLLVVLFRFSLGNATVGRPRSVWESKIHRFCRYKLLGNWVDLAKSEVWIDMIDDFVSFCLPHQWKWRYICFNFRLLCHFRLRPKKARRTAFKHEMKCKKFLCIVNVCVCDNI